MIDRPAPSNGVPRVRVSRTPGTDSHIGRIPRQPHTRRTPDVSPSGAKVSISGSVARRDSDRAGVAGAGCSSRSGHRGAFGGYRGAGRSRRATAGRTPTPDGTYMHGTSLVSMIEVSRWDWNHSQCVCFRLSPILHPRSYTREIKVTGSSIPVNPASDETLLYPMQGGGAAARPDWHPQSNLLVPYHKASMIRSES